MSDYLSNIAAKALNLLPVIEPRPLSLFEPTSGLGGAFDYASAGRSVDTALGVAGYPAETTTGAQPPQRQGFVHLLTYDDGRRAATVQAAAAAEPLPNVQPTEPDAVPSDDSAVVVPPADRVTTGTASAITATPVRPGSDDTPRPLPQNWRAPLVASPVPPPVGAAESDVSVASGDSSIVPTFSGPQDDTSVVRVRRLAQRARGAQQLASTTSPIVVQALVVPACESSMPLGEEPTTPQAAPPTIRVNIGRVEVRAIMSPAPAAPRPKAPRPAPKPSLADYLQSSQRGR